MSIGPTVGRSTVATLLNDFKRRIRGLEAAVEIAQFDIKIFGDTQLVTTGDGKFIWAVPADLDGARLLRAEAYVTTNGSTFTGVQIRNVTQTVNLLTTQIRIDASEPTSYTSSVPSVADPDLLVSVEDLLAVDVDTAGTGSKGLGVILDFGP